ncbi:PREDICTED: uncharacterized protein LOC109588785 [Amphimedon queenslandica]|uniref:CARD domain-containing protein n=1 Tax=Amphimedon queenslandica TaxID=400682 RepID=A0AAN0JTT5_AMPQE|nr:PREDICTED: uncharacterized protein LOC109588785 [Amphimedon queenslandica]|eukprot:XP_019860457.1 PREDICTED: uncharacterized protein LOC109588785 [Amphimedon queenslandica]
MTYPVNTPRERTVYDVCDLLSVVREGRPFLVSDNGHKELTEILSDESLSDISNLSLLGGRDIKELIEIAEEFNTPLTTEPTSQKSSSSTQISESDLDNKGDGGVKCNNNKDKGTTTNTLNESQEHGSTSIEKGQSAGTPNTPTSNDESTSPTKQRTPKEILQEYSAKLSKAIAADVSNVVNALFSNDLIPEGTREYVMTVVGVATADKADRVMTDVIRQLEASLDERQYLVDVCNILIQQGAAMKKIGNFMLKEL